MLKCTRHEAILWIVALHDMFHEWHLLKAHITPVLSPLNVTSQSDKPCWTIHRMASSRATDSAKPMSRSSLSQFSRRHHAAQCSPTTRPMPHDNETSTHMSRSIEQWGRREREPPGITRLCKLLIDSSFNPSSQVSCSLAVKHGTASNSSVYISIHLPHTKTKENRDDVVIC